MRLERVDNTVNALCSADGNEWFTVDHVEFPVDDPVEVGLFAIGTLYQPHLYSISIYISVNTFIIVIHCQYLHIV